MRHGYFLSLLALSMILGPQATASDGTSAKLSWDEQCAAFFRMIGPMPKAYGECVAQSGPNASKKIRMALGDTREILNASLPNPLAEQDTTWVTGSPLNIDWAVGGNVIMFDDVGGMSQTVLILSLGLDDRLQYASFAWQNRPLQLQEAFEKMADLRGSFEAEGFRLIDAESFLITDEHDAPKSHAPRNWVDLESFLRDETQGAVNIRILRARNDAAEVTASLENGRRAVANFSRDIPKPIAGYNSSAYEGSGGFEWLLHVTMARAE